MTITYEQIKNVSERIITTPIKGKEYAAVNGRINAFRQLYPQGFIMTEIVSLQDGMVVVKATCGYYENGQAIILGSDHAYEKEGSSNINRTSFIENACTSAIGRALGACGLGISTAVASAEEMNNAINQQEEYKQNADGERRTQLITEIQDMVKDISQDEQRTLLATSLRDAGIRGKTIGTLLVNELEELKIAVRAQLSKVV